MDTITDYPTIQDDIAQDALSAFSGAWQLDHEAAFVGAWDMAESSENPEPEGLGLSTSHISPHGIKIKPHDLKISYKTDLAGLERVAYERPVSLPTVNNQQSTIVTPRAEVYAGGTLVTVKRERVKVLGERGRSGGGMRGRVTTFSKGSRRRLMRTLAKLEREQVPTFVTLTYPDQFPQDEKRWKRDIDALGKRFRRRFDAGAFVWRIELKERKSGANEGQIAPHYHLLVWGASFGQLKDWLPGAWFGVVGSGDEKHLRAGTRVERVRSWRGVMSYASKYIAKIDETERDGDVGRWWGIVNRNAMPWAALLVVELTRGGAVKALRLCRKLAKLKGKDLPTLTVFCNSSRFLDYLEWLL